MRTYYVVAYDIRDDRRRLKIARCLAGYGQRVQYSVFEVYLNEADFLRMLYDLQEIIDPEEDRVAVYPLFEVCRRKILRFGIQSPLRVDEDYWVV